MENEPGDTTDEAPGEDEPGLIETVIERMRGTGVGTEDPNIIGDAGPTDVPPGHDPGPEWPPREVGDPPAGVEENPEAPG